MCLTRTTSRDEELCTQIPDDYHTKYPNVLTLYKISDLDVQLHDDRVGPGEGDQLGQSGADHGVPGHGGPQPRGQLRGGDEPSPALVGRVVGHGEQALHLVTVERNKIRKIYSLPMAGC